MEEKGEKREVSEGERGRESENKARDSLGLRALPPKEERPGDEARLEKLCTS